MSLQPDTYELAVFLPRITAHISGADADMVSTFVMDSVIEFARDSHVLRELLCIPLVECTTSYKLNTQNRKSELLHARFFVNGVLLDEPNINYRCEGDILYIHNFPPNTLVELEYVTTPYRDSTVVATLFYEDWVDAITNLTLSKLYLLQDPSTYNPAAANNHMALYRQELRRARVRKLTKHRSAHIRLRNKRVL